MALSKQLQTTLRTFHLDNPDATWDQLRDHLRDLAENILATPTEWERMDSMGLVYSDVQEDLYRIAVTSALTHAQAQAITLGQQIMLAAQERVMGDPRQLVGLIERMNGAQTSNSHGLAHASLSVGPKAGPTGCAPVKSQPPITFGELADLYMNEQEGNLRPITLRGVRSGCKTIAEILGQLDIRSHTRKDLLALRESLLKARKPSTVNNLLTRLSTVLTWGVNNGYLEKAWDKKLKVTKGAESAREAFTQEQVMQLVAYANGLPVSSWERWVLSLGAITGARINEIRQLLKRDIRQLGDAWVIDINTDEDKDLKNKHSARLVPLIDGAYGFSLADFLCFVESRPDGAELFNTTRSYTGQVLGAALRRVLKVEAGGALTFHSFRHSLASLFKQQDVSLGLAQAILGHSAQSITFDHYGAGQRVGVEKLADALRGVLLSNPV